MLVRSVEASNDGLAAVVCALVVVEPDGDLIEVFVVVVVVCQRLETSRKFNAAGWDRGKWAARSISVNFFWKKVKKSRKNNTDTLKNQSAQTNVNMDLFLLSLSLSLHGRPSCGAEALKTSQIPHFPEETDCEYSTLV